MKQPWIKNTISIASLFSFRMLGLFFLIPVFSVYANQLHHATPTLIGIALGAYGLTQSVFQIPLGVLSDKYGRKPILIFGFIVFAIGSILGAYTKSIEGMVVARALQGAGAVGSVLIALLSDLTHDSVRTKAMAIIGSTIGISFSLAIILSPYITRHFGLSGIFIITASLAILAIFIIQYLIPSPQITHLNTNTINYKNIICNKHLMRLNIGIFFQHVLLTATFFAIPLLLQQQIKTNHLSSLWHFYLPIVGISFIVMIPCIGFAERKKQVKMVFNLSIAAIIISQMCFIFAHNSIFSISSLLFIYFVAFNILEANLPSLISKQADINNRGSAMGIYSSFQYLGIFAGGSIAGILFQWQSYTGIFMFNTAIAMIWLVIAYYMQPQQYELLISIPYTKPVANEEFLKKELSALSGVRHVNISRQDKLIHLRVEKALYKEMSAEKIINPL